MSQKAQRILTWLGAAFCVSAALFFLSQGGAFGKLSRQTRGLRLAPQAVIALSNAPHEGTLPLNAMAEHALMALPGIGEGLAGRILAYRDSVGGFVNVEELARIPGIGSMAMDRLRPLLCVCWEPHGEALPGDQAAPHLDKAGGTEAAPPTAPPLLNINCATHSDWVQLPGIGTALADAIVQDREQNGPFERLEDLLRVPGIGGKRLEAILPYLAVD